MTIDTRKQIEADFNEISRMLLKLGNMSGEALTRSVWALERLDMATAHAVIEGDDPLDDLTEWIEEKCMAFGARHQPLGRDLRAVLSTMHMAVDLERIGDYGVNISRVVLALEGKSFIKPLLDIPRMSEVFSEMLHCTLNAYDTSDPEMAKRVFMMDGEIDALEKQVMRELFTMVLERADRFEQAFLLIGVARALERAGDHLTNIAERVVYICTGKSVRASDFKKRKQ
ncbi:MAG: phosphate signaling complex protein PhoU [Fretibacterium sp.]|nr:phosphate signaling complex protein PhoU [Fretibacterium sp.]